MTHNYAVYVVSRRCLLWTAAISMLFSSPSFSWYQATTTTNTNTHHYVLGMTIKTTKSRLMRQPQEQEEKVYRYFGFGSNVLPSTMKALRQIEVRPDSVTAAILPGYELKFYSDAAFVRHVENSDGGGSDGSVVHGVLYTLTDEEFAKVGQTEGVPFGYRWQSCLVYPYKGDMKRAGYDCLNKSTNDKEKGKETKYNDNTLSSPVEAYTLVEASPLSLFGSSTKQKRKEIPPSLSYLGLIQEGARLWRFDSRYQDFLASIEISSSNGLSEIVLRIAEKFSGTKRTYMIDGYDID